MKKVEDLFAMPIPHVSKNGTIYYIDEGPFDGTGYLVIDEPSEMVTAQADASAGYAYSCDWSAPAQYDPPYTDFKKGIVPEFIAKQNQQHWKKKSKKKW